MTNGEIAKNNMGSYVSAFWVLETQLEVATKNLDFYYKFDTSINQIHNENYQNDGFVVRQYNLRFKNGIKNYLDLSQKIYHKFGFENTITMICDHNFDGGEFSLVFRQAFFIGKDGLLHTFDNLESLTNKIKQIVYE